MGLNIRIHGINCSDNFTLSYYGYDSGFNNYDAYYSKIMETLYEESDIYYMFDSGSTYAENGVYMTIQGVSPEDSTFIYVNQ